MADDVKRSWDGRPLDWRNKPTDRFVLRAIKRYLSAPVTLAVRRVSGARPWMFTVAAATLGTAAGLLFALGHGVVAGAVAAAAQILDGVDGQLARLSGRESRAGALLDSALDRYADGAMVVGAIIYLVRTPPPFPLAAPTALAVGFLALVGANLVSYTGARAGELGVALARPTLASKGTRTTALVLGALASALWPSAPLLALAYIALHANCAAVNRLIKAYRQR